MNGRVYDPVIARFLSPDPFVQFPGVADGYNRYSYVMNNPLIFTDPSGYMPNWVQDEYDHYYRNSGGDDRRNEGGGGGWNPFGWINNSMNIGGWTKNPGDYWHYSPVSGTYYNSETSERRQANNESTKAVLYDAGFEVNDNIEEGATASVYLFLGMGSYQDNKTALRQDILGNYEVWLPLFTATYGEYFTQMITSSGGGDEGLVYPVSTAYRISSGYTENNRIIAELNQSRPHRAIDIATPVGTPIVSPYSGNVTTAQKFSYGQAIIIQHDYIFNGQSLSTSYSHLSRMSVNAGDPVTRGQIIGYTGTYGTGPHLHFVVRLDGQKVNPIIVFPLYHP
jgi:murein DD-endopeptidase MepM/ murein hydrolase activator NlpD